MHQRRTRILIILAILVVLALLAGAVLVAANRHPAPSPSPVPTASAPAASPDTAPSASVPVVAFRLGDPNPSLTPGVVDPAVTQANISTTICVKGYTATVRPPSSYTTNLKIQQIEEYGYADKSTASYEEDHLISLELGGSPRDPDNLWPEPYSLVAPDGSDVGARVKDKLENYLHRLVCTGAMSLAAAQDQIAHDWLGHWLADGSPKG